MKALKIIGIVLLIIVALFLIIPLFMASSYSVERSTVIDRPVETVFPQVADFNNWVEWNPWSEMEPGSRNLVSGTPMSEGSSWSWEGEVIGSGTLTIVNLAPNRLIESELVFKAPMQGTADDSWQFAPTADGGTEVTWKNSGGLDYPVGRWFRPMVEAQLGGQFERGLANLKARCESMPVPVEHDSTMMNIETEE